MNRLASISSLSKIFRGDFPGIEEMACLLNLLPDAALLMDGKRGQIVLVNSALLKLTAFSQKELIGRDIAVLINSLEGIPSVGETENRVHLLRRNRHTLPVTMKVIELSQGSPWQLIRFASQVSSSGQSTLDLQAYVNAYLELAKYSGIASLPALLEKSVKTANALLSTDVASIYQVDSDFPSLQRAASHESTPVFPETVSSTDLVRLSEPFIWTPGKRVFTEIHRLARIANLAFVASTPLGQEAALVGLLVVGSTEHQPSPAIEGDIRVIGSIISDLLQRNILTTNLKQEMMSLRRLAAIRDIFIENAQEAILVIDPNFRVSGANSAAERILGYTDWEVKGQPVKDILIGPDQLIAGLGNASSSRQNNNYDALLLHRRDGTIFPANIKILPVQQNAELVALIVLIDDISSDEQYRFNTRQLEHRAALGEITAAFAHDIRNPINNISAGLQLLSMRMDAEDPKQDMVKRMLGDCSRLDQLVGSIVSYSRPLERLFKPLDINQCIQRILVHTEARLAQANVKLFYKPEPNLPQVDGDASSLERVLGNLISNAVDAMRENGGTLAIRTIEYHGIPNLPQVEISVSDNGSGIPDDIRDRIFESFVTNNPRGTGLGLAISKQIITAHHGSINVESFPGGTVFRVYLPLSRSGEKA